MKQSVRVLILLLVAALVLPSLADARRAEAETVANNWNIAMGNHAYAYWPETAYVTVVRALNEQALTISLQEVCQDQWLTIGQALYPYGYRALYRETISADDQAFSEDCNETSRGNAVYAKGTNLGNVGGNMQLTPIEGQKRYLVCMKSQAYIYYTTCSTHITTNPAVRVEQANVALYFWLIAVRPQGTFSITGADFNQVHPTSATNNWWIHNIEMASLQTTYLWWTHYIPPYGGNKIDYIWADRAIFQQVNAQPCQQNSVYSDHFHCTGRFS